LKTCPRKLARDMIDFTTYSELAGGHSKLKTSRDMIALEDTTFLSSVSSEHHYFRCKDREDLSIMTEDMVFFTFP